MLASNVVYQNEELQLLQIIPAPGEMANLIRSYDWSKSVVGPIKNWPQSLLTAVNFLLSSKFPIILYWGLDLVEIYNDAYIPLPGAKHPQTLGRPVRETWPEIWEVLQPMFHNVMTHGVATWSSDQLLLMTRNNYLEECYFTWSFSPVRIEDGSVGGAMTPVVETTQLVLSARRFETVKTLSSKIVNLKNIEQVAKMTISVLKENLADVPFALIYLLNGALDKLLLCSSSCEGLNLQQAPLEIDLDEESSTWPIKEVLASKQLIIVDNLVEKLGEFPGGVWPESPDKAVIMPLILKDTEKPYGIFIMGINPRRAFEDDYKNFVHLISRQLTSAISMAKSYQDEYQRAEALVELDRAKTTFFSNVSHEFRTPLTLMLGPLEDSLTDKLYPLNNVQKERQLLIYRNTTRLLKLVNSLLDFSRLEENRMQAIYEPSDMVKLTTNLSSVFRSTIERAGLEFVVNVGAVKELVYLDQEMFEKIIFNLLSNAFKFTLQGKISIKLEQHEHNVVLKVQDTGVGIPEYELPKMFERFHRIEQTQGRSYEGSGIGLALVQELVKLHGGSIQVRSTLGQGTTFTITFPLGKEHLPEEQIGKRGTYDLGRIGSYFIEEATNWLPNQKQIATEYNKTVIHDPVAKASSTPFITSTKATILVVDDNVDMCKYLTSLLRQYWQVEVVHDGEAALEALQQRLPDLILSDVMMPKLNGIELLKEIRLKPATKFIPFILLSARAGEEARLEGLQIGADDYLVKPFSAKELLTRVNIHLELGGLRKGLEQQIKQRTAELKKTHKALEAQIQKRLQAQKELSEHAIARARDAEERQKKLGEFIDTICHEIRNPLNIIYGGATLLQEDIKFLVNLVEVEKNLTTAARSNILHKKLLLIQHHLTGMLIAAGQQKAVVDDILDLSKIETGNVDMHPLPFELNEVVRNITQMFKIQCKQKNLKFIVNIVDKEKVWLKLDEQCLNRVLINLISNSIKFTNKGSITLTVSTKAISENDVIVNFSVKDTGVGMSPQELEHTFNRFARINRRKTSVENGSGLGLAISKNLVELMGGRIEVKSQKCLGSEFNFTIKCAYASEYETQEIIASRKACLISSDKAVNINNKKILIVEDNIFNQKILARYLKGQDYSYEIAGDGLEAVEKCAKIRFDLIFMDIEMPNLDGIKATKRIRLQEAGKFRTPIIALTGYTSQEFQNKALLAGMDNYLLKPCLPDVIYATIKQYTTTEVISDRVSITPQFRDYKIASKLNKKEINTKEIIKEFRLKATLLLAANFPFKVDLNKRKFTIELELTQSKLSTYSALIALKKLKKYLQQSLALIVGVNLELDKEQLQLYITVTSKKHLPEINYFLTEVGFLISPAAYAPQEEGVCKCTII